MTKDVQSHKKRGVLKSKKVLAFVAIAVVLVSVLLYMYYPKLQSGVMEKKGSAEQVEQYHSDALKAWHKGDKKKAQQLSREFKKNNEALSDDERQKIPNQAQMMFQADDMLDGLEPL